MHAPDILRWVRTGGDRVAFRHGNDSLTWAELDRRSRAFADVLQERGVERGDRVASFLGTSFDLVVAFVGVVRAKAIWVPVNDRYGPTEISHILDDSGARLALVEPGSACAQIVADAGGPPALHVDGLAASEPGAPAAGRRMGEPLVLDGEASESGAPAAGRHHYGPDDPVLFIYTSGTTGPSKGVVHTHQSLGVAIDALTRLWRWTPDDELVLALPLFHVHGFGIGIVGTLLRGNRTVLLDRFEPAEVADAVEEGGTIFMGVPTMYSRLLDALDADETLGGRLAGARLFTSGSDALPAANFERFTRHTGHRILERYGMSETMLTLSNPYEPDARKPGSVGFPVPGMQARIVDETGEPTAIDKIGDLHVRGPFVMREYWGQPDKTAASFDGDWFITGDVGSFDADGAIHLAGRKSVDIIKSGGFKISAKEIETALRAHQAVRQAAVLGLPDPEWGQRIVAAIVLEEGEPVGDSFTDELSAHVEARLANYKCPREWAFVDALPRNALGKVQKRKLESAFE